MAAKDRVQDEPPGLGRYRGVPRLGRLRRLASVGVAVALALVTLELVARRYAYIPRRLDPEFGYIATGEARWFREGTGVGHWGARGVRQPSAPTSGSAKRILVLGDSFTEAAHVNDDEVYTDVLERRLRAAGRKVRVVNAGVTGSTLPYYVHLAASYRRAFSPDWTVVQLNPDDVLAPAFAKLGTHFERLRDGSLAVRALPAEGRGGPLRRTLRFLTGHSALLQNGVLQHKAFVVLAKSFKPFRQTDKPPTAKPEAPGAFPIEQEMQLLSQAFDGRVTVLFISPWADSGPVGGATPTETSIEEACRKLGLSFVSTRASFPRLVAAGLFPNGFPNTQPKVGHLNATGHAAVAEVLGQELLSGTPSAVF